MARRGKWTYEEVYDYFKEQGCELLTIKEEYKGTKQYLDYICSCGNPSKIKFSNFKNKGQRCRECSKKKLSKTKTLTYEYVKQYFEDHGCELLSTTYINNNLLLDYICCCGNISKINFSNFKSGHRCKKCGNEKLSKNNKHSYDFIKKYFEDNNCVLLSKEYNGVHEPLDFICECGNISKIAFSHFKNGGRCIKCGGKEKLTYEFVKQYFEDNDCILLSKEYYRAHDPLEYICKCGNKAKISFANFQSGQRCISCRSEKMRKTMYENGTAPKSIQQIYLYNLLNGELNYPIDICSLDIAFPEEMIYCEYDGGGHRLSIILGTETEENFNKRNIKRWYILKNKGWREIRITSEKDFLPSDGVLLEIIKYAKKYLNTGHSWIKFDIDNKLVESSQFKNTYNYGELRKITKKDIA